MSDKYIQKIVMNMETGMSLGRMYAQVAHASVLALLNRGTQTEQGFSLSFDGDEGLKEWMQKAFTKVVVKGWGNEELTKLSAWAATAGVPVGNMEEDGWVTAVAVGPGPKHIVDQVVEDVLGKVYLV